MLLCFRGQSSTYHAKEYSMQKGQSSSTFGSERSILFSDIDRTLVANSSIVISNKKGNNKTRMAKKVEEISISNNITGNITGIASSDKPRFTFRNLIHCGGVDTKDSSVVMAHNKQNRPPLFNMCSSYHRDTCKKEKLGGSDDDRMILGKARRTYHRWVNSKSCEGLKESAKREDQCRDEKAASTAYKTLINRPNCSQCGKPFEPEKLHGHMKSCRGMKVKAKASSSCAVSAVAADNKSLKSRKRESASGYFLY
ncbi:hypothetical protein OROGR_020574 [Orobanche gracilis]